MSTSSERIEYIKKHFSLTQISGEWVARWIRPDGSVFSEYKDADCAALRSKVRARWGHFNYEDEAIAFAEIFPR